MSANTPGGYLGQGGKRMSRKPDFNPLPGVPALYDAMRQEDLHRALQAGPPLPPGPITEGAAAANPGAYPIPSLATQPDGRVIREIQQRGVGAEPVGPVVGTSKTVQYPPEQSLMPSAVAPTSKDVQYPPSAPPTSSWDRPEDRRLRKLREEWERRRGDAAWTTTPQAPAPGVANVPQPPAAGQSAPGTLTPEQMQQMGSPSPDARRYDGLNYKSNNVVSASRAVGDARGRMGGSAVGRKQSEAISQMTRIANGMAEGRGGQQYRDAVAAFEAAIASGDQTSINAAEANLSMLLSPMLDKFDARFKGEVGDIGIDIRKQFMDTLRGRIQAGTAGTMRGMPQSAAMPPQTGGMPGAPQVRGPQAPSRPTPQQPQSPRVGPGGIRSYQFGSMDEAYKGINSGQMQSGDLVTIAGSNYTAVPTFDANGNPEWGLAPAFAFGGVGDTPAMAVPDPFSFPDADAWGSSLSDLQRQTMLDALMTDPSLRSSLERGTLDQIDRVRRSRQGLMRNSMSAKDRETAMRTLRLEENAALYAAMGSVGARGQGRAMSMSQYMEGERQAEASRRFAEEATKKQMELDAAEVNRVRNAEIKEEQDRVAAERTLQLKAYEAEIDAARKDAEDRRGQFNETVNRRREMVPHTREAVRGFVDGGKDVKSPIDDPTVKRLWDSLSPDQRDQYERWSSLLAETAPEFDEPLRDSEGAIVYERNESGPITDEQGNKIPVKRPAPLNPNAFLPRADLIRVLQSLSKYQPPPQMEPETTRIATSADPDAATELGADKIAAARNKMLLEWWQDNNGKMVGEIITRVAKHAPGLEREMLSDMGIDRTAATSLISEWQSNVFEAAVASKDLGRIREALLDLHGLATIANATGASYELSGLQRHMTVDPEVFADAVINEMRGNG